ncbi:MAG: ribosome-associated translation inhibitor RaiA [Planctomycetaceae bacterium]|jgi:putative sigma-54 modulation protein|nr:ribosome-associated translation inhibitor RaiA [Planctomycetaceae bacterium]
MQINISARHGDLSEATKEKITQKIEKIQRYFERMTAIDVTVDLSKADEPGVEVIVKSEHKHDFVADVRAERSGDLFGAVDQVIAKLEQQIRKHKEKLQDHGKNPPAGV